MKTIIFSSDCSGRGGKERQIAILASGLIAKGYNIFIAFESIDPHSNYFNEYKLNNKILVFKRFSEFNEIIKKTNPDLVVSWDVKSSFYNLLLYRIFKYKYINGSIQHGIRIFKFSHLVRSLIALLSSYVMANSETGLRVNNLKSGKSRFVLYNGIEPKFLNNLSEQDIEILRKKIIPGYSENPGLIYVSVANFVPYKDYFSNLKALKKLKSHFEFYYLVIGDGPMRAEIEKKICEYGLEKDVILIGETENVKEYLFASDIMIHSSRGEGISNAILEGMYAGLPIIASNVGGIPETVFSGSSLLYPYNDHKALYNCLLKSNELIAGFDPKSKEYHFHLNKFSVEVMLNKFEEIIHIVKDN